jgi:uncharacterized protein (DUF1330 family)
MPAYLIADIEVNDGQAYEEYRKQVPALITHHGGRYLARGGATEVLEGDWKPRRTVIVEFPTMSALKAFWDSADYKPLRGIRWNSASSNVVAVEGL